MQIVSIKSNGTECAAIITERGYVRIDVLNEEKRSFWPESFDVLKNSPELPRLLTWYDAGGKTVLHNFSSKLIVPRAQAEENSAVLTVLA